MTAEEMLATYRRALDTVEAGDRDGFLDVVDPRISFITIPDWPDGGSFEGPDAVWRFLAEFYAVLSSGEFEIIEPVAPSGTTLAFDMRRFTSGTQSGAMVEWHYGVVVEFRNGRILRNQFYDTREDALAAARDG